MTTRSVWCCGDYRQETAFFHGPLGKLSKDAVPRQEERQDEHFSCGLYLAVHSIVFQGIVFQGDGVPGAQCSGGIV